MNYRAQAVYLKWPVGTPNEDILNEMHRLNIRGILLDDRKLWLSKERYISVFIADNTERMLFKIRYSGELVNYEETFRIT